MRIWHKDMISTLPQQQLVSQWKELSAIVGKIQKCGTPNHRLVNKILDYPFTHLEVYAQLIDDEMTRRNYKVAQCVRDKIYNFCYSCRNTAINNVTYEALYSEWHNERYLKQCLINLQEKYDCLGVPKDEWKLIQDKFGYLFDYEL